MPKELQPRYYHSLTATNLAAGITVATAFGGRREFHSDQMAKTTLFEFGEYDVYVYVLGMVCTYCAV